MKGIIVMWTCIILVWLGLWVIRSHYEAKTYSEITGKQVTTGQALWVQFRIVEPYPTE